MNVLRKGFSMDDRFDFIGYSDGGCDNNTHSGGYGSYAIFFADYPVTLEHFTLPEVKTSPESEYMSLIKLLEFILRYQGDHKNFYWKLYSDCQLMVRQINGDYAVKAKNLKPLHQIVRDFFEQIGEIELVWTPRRNIVKVLGH